MKNHNPIPFNKPCTYGNYKEYIDNVYSNGKYSGNGDFTKTCQNFLETFTKTQKVLLTSSCTDALEMCAILLELKPGDEVIIPSYTFVSTALAFIREGAKVVFADSSELNPNVDVESIRSKITSKTKAIVVVHYAGFSAELSVLKSICNSSDIFLIEDAAQAIDSYQDELPLGSIGDLGTLSFHETKNIHCGEGGALLINNPKLISRAEVIWEKGTNRSDFLKGKVDKYRWIDKGSSFLPSEFQAAFLLSQLEGVKSITKKRIELWHLYHRLLSNNSEHYEVPYIPCNSNHNAHIFYITLKKTENREKLINFAKNKKIQIVTHYQSLHQSPFYKKNYENGDDLKNSDYYTNSLLRLPLFYDLKMEQVELISQTIIDFFKEEVKKN